MKIKTVLLTAIAVLLLGSLAVPANALGRHHHRHHHGHHHHNRQA